MIARLLSSLATFAAIFTGGILVAPAQDDIVRNFDVRSEGAWSDVDGTTLIVPLAAEGAVEVDGEIAKGEYGTFEGITVTPGVNAWVQNFPGDRTWDSADDSSFTFWLAHDLAKFYVGVEVRDDVVVSDNDNLNLWKDDAIELVVDSLNNRYDNNTDSDHQDYGGHCYVSFDGRFSEWDDAGGFIARGRWSGAVNWSYGAAGEIFATGQEVDGGWQMEICLAKTLFEDPAAGNTLNDDYVMGFNIGVDDDDKRGSEGSEGSGERSRDLEVQYWWANRSRLLGWNDASAASYTEEEIANGEHEKDFVRGIDPAGRIAHGGTGEIVFAATPAPFEIIDVTLDRSEPDAEVTVTWNSKRGRTYRIDASDDAEMWLELEDGIASEGLQTSYIDRDVPAGAKARYYRIGEE